MVTNQYGRSAGPNGPQVVYLDELNRKIDMIIERLDLTETKYTDIKPIRYFQSLYAWSPNNETAPDFNIDDYRIEDDKIIKENDHRWNLIPPTNKGGYLFRVDIAVGINNKLALLSPPYELGQLPE